MSARALNKNKSNGKYINIERESFLMTYDTTKMYCNGCNLQRL